MSTIVQEFRTRAEARATELLDTLAAAEGMIVSAIERECEALRTGRMLAAEALHLRLCDAARLYLHATKAARASLRTVEHILPGTAQLFENRRIAFADLLKVELAVLAAERAAADYRPADPPTGAPPMPARVTGASHPAAGRTRRPNVRLVAGGAASQDARAGSPSRRRGRR
jgi:hypothetical protein